MKLFIKQNQILLFFILSFVFSWFPWYAGIAPEVMGLGPSLAAFILVIVLAGKSGLLNFLRPVARWRASLGLWAFAILGPACLYLLGLGVYLSLGGEPPPFTMLREELHLLLPYLFLVVLSPLQGPIGEEFGWRGFALPKLQTYYGPLLASVILGSLWGLWHLPTLFAPLGVLSVLVSAMGLIFIVPYTLGTIANTIFMTWLYNKTGGSALIAGIVWHAAVNFWAPVLLSDSSLVAAQEGTHLPTIATSLYLTVLAVQIVAAILLTMVTRGRLGLPKSKKVATPNRQEAVQDQRRLI